MFDDQVLGKLSEGPGYPSSLPRPHHSKIPILTTAVCLWVQPSDPATAGILGLERRI